MNEIATYLGPKGYTILKEYLDIDDLNLIRKELTVKPFVPKTSLASPPSFAVFQREFVKAVVDPSPLRMQPQAIPFARSHRPVAPGCQTQFLLPSV